MDPLALQRKLKSNNEDLMQFCKDLKSWRQEIGDQPDKKTSTEKKSTVKEKKSVDKPKKNDKNPLPKNKLGVIDYSVWDKMNVDSESEDENSSNLSDEHDETARDEAYVHKEKGNKFVKEQQWDEAIACYTKAIELYLYDPIFYANRALCFLKNQNYEKAEADATKSIALDQTYVKAFQRRAAAREALGKLQEAEADLAQVLEIEPKNKESLNKIVELKEKLKTNKQQRPVSKFTLSRNRDRPTVNLEPSNSKIFKVGLDHGDDDIIPIKAIVKPAHLKSRTPLRSVPIVEITGSESLLSRTSLNTDDLKVIQRVN